MVPEFWLTGEVCQKLKISRATLGRWRNKLGFPTPIHIGGHDRSPARYIIADVLAWLAERGFPLPQ